MVIVVKISWYGHGTCDECRTAGENLFEVSSDKDVSNPVMESIIHLLFIYYSSIILQVLHLRDADQAGKKARDQDRLGR